MDKQTSDTVKIKINGKERPVSDKEKVKISSWEEKLKAEKEIASAKKEEEDFPWLLPDEDDPIFEEDPKVVTPPKKKKLLSNQTVTPFQYSKKAKTKSNIVAFPMKQMLTVVLLAIGLGVGFGYIALNFLSNKDMPATATPDEVMTNDTPANETTEETTNEGAPTAANSSATLQLFAVQGGIFSSKQSAETVVNDIKSKGLASTVIETDGSFTVLAGLGKEKAETDALNQLYKEKNFADFWGGKQLSMKISTTKSPEQWASSIAALSSLASATSNGQSVNQEELTSLESTLNEIETGNDSEKSSIEKLLQAISNIKENKGWEAQQKILDVVQTLQS